MKWEIIYLDCKQRFIKICYNLAMLRPTSKHNEPFSESRVFVTGTKSEALGTRRSLI